MKRITVICSVLVFLLIAIGGGIWWYIQVQGYVSPATYLPSDTVFYGEIPNGKKALLHFQGSKLQKMAQSDEVKALSAWFGGKIKEGGKSEGSTTVSSKLEKLDKIKNSFLRAMGGTAFVALTQLDTPTLLSADLMGKETHFEVDKMMGAVAGFYGSPESGKYVDELAVNVSELFGGAFEDGKLKKGESKHGEISYVYYEVNEPGITVRFCRARWNGWDLFSIGEKPLMDFLDRVAGVGKGPSLAENAAYRDLCRQVGGNQDMLMYFDLGRFCNVFADFLEKELKVTEMTTVADFYRGFGAMKGLVWGINFSNGDMVERSAFFMPKELTATFGWSRQPLNRKTFEFTTPSTLIFGANMRDWEGYYDSQIKLYEQMNKGNDMKHGGINPYAIIDQSLKSEGLSIRDNLIGALGPEMVYTLDWPEGQEYPDLMVFLGLKDEKKFSPLYDRINLMLIGVVGALQGKKEPFKAGDYEGTTVSLGQYPKISPTLFKSREFFGISLNKEGAARLLSGREKSLSEGELTGGIKAGGQLQGIGYFKMDKLTERSYKLAKPYLAEYLKNSYDEDTKALASKLPDELTVTKTMGNLWYAMWLNGEFEVTEIRSSIGSPTMAFGFGAGVAAMAFDSMRKIQATQYQKQKELMEEQPSKQDKE